MFQLSLVLLSGLLLRGSYRCCFVPGVPAVARFTDASAFPSAVDFFSSNNVSMFLAVPAVVGVPAIVGFPVVFVSPLLLTSLLLLVYLHSLVILLLLWPCCCCSF
jgi:hypothetical protein